MSTPTDQAADLAPLSCARCGVALQPGSGNFYRITIEAVADPAPPNLPALDLADLRTQIEQLLIQLEGLSEQEALEQVYHRVVLSLCSRCYRQWIANPTGSPISPASFGP